MAESGGHFLRAPGRFTRLDGTRQVSVSASQNNDKMTSVLISWHVDDSTFSDTVPQLGNDWFVFAEDASHVWVFDGGRHWLASFIAKTQADTFIPPSEVDKRCPKEVRDALPDSYRAK